MSTTKYFYLYSAHSLFKNRFYSLRTSSNLLLLNLCISGLGIVLPNAIFFINLYHKGPFTGVLGAKVCPNLFVPTTEFAQQWKSMWTFDFSIFFLVYNACSLLILSILINKTHCCAKHVHSLSSRYRTIDHNWATFFWLGLRVPVYGGGHVPDLVPHRAHRGARLGGPLHHRRQTPQGSHSLLTNSSYFPLLAISCSNKKILSVVCCWWGEGSGSSWPGPK